MNNLITHNIISPKDEIEKNDQTNLINWIRESCQKIITIEIIDNITLLQAKEIQKWIIEENQEHKHMIEKSIEQIRNEINSWLWFVAMINWEISWCITMIKIKTMNWSVIYEVWSLITAKNKRWVWIAKKLTNEIFEKNKDKNLYSITEVEWVKHIYEEYLWLYKVSKNELNTDILEKIEEIWELLETDEIYVNNNFIINSMQKW